MKSWSAALLIAAAWLAVAAVPSQAQVRSSQEIVLGEKDGLKAILRIQSPASLIETDWLQIDIINSGPAGRIKTMRLNGAEIRGGLTSSSILSEVTLGTPTGRNPTIFAIPEGKYTTTTPSVFAGVSFGLPRADTAIKLQVTLSLELEDGRSLSPTESSSPLTLVWTRPGAAEIEALQRETVALLTKAIPRESALSTVEWARLRRLLGIEETSRAVTLDQALAALKQGQIEGSVRFREVMDLVIRRWRSDPAAIEFYREALVTRGPKAVADLSMFAPTIWDNSFIDLVAGVIEAAARPPVNSQALSRGIGLLDRNYASWSSDTSLPPRLSKAVRESKGALDGWNGTASAFYNFVNLLVMTHDRTMIGVLRPYLMDRTIDQFTSLSSIMPSGRTPMRYSELAASGITRLLGEPAMFDPWQRAAAPREGPYPEWAEWDKQIAALQQRLDAMPKP